MAYYDALSLPKLVPAQLSISRKAKNRQALVGIIILVEGRKGSWDNMILINSEFVKILKIIQEI